MILDKQFFVTYYATKHKAFITRKAKWDRKCEYKTTKKGNACMTYFDIDANDYRHAVGNVRVKWN